MCFFFFKQKTAYEMRISDWSSDVCSSDLMHARMARHGVALRPHLKTAKSARVAQLATDGQPDGITVSTLAEAAYFLKHGFRDITYAVGILPGRLDQVAALQTQGADLKIITDNTDAARAIADRAARGDAVFRVLVEIDTGDHRAGVLPESEELLAIARILHAARGDRKSTRLNSSH